jgi:hypothetical protein
MDLLGWRENVVYSETVGHISDTYVSERQRNDEKIWLAWVDMSVDGMEWGLGNMNEYCGKCTVWCVCC